jgi:hypothetical protein
MNQPKYRIFLLDAKIKVSLTGTRKIETKLTTRELKVEHILPERNLMVVGNETITLFDVLEENDNVFDKTTARFLLVDDNQAYMHLITSFYAFDKEKAIALYKEKVKEAINNILKTLNNGLIPEIKQVLRNIDNINDASENEQNKQL